MLAKYHYAVLIHEQAKKYGTKPVITFRNFGTSIGRKKENGYSSLFKRSYFK